MSGKPAARVTDPTTCPVPGHGSNPIVQGSPDVVFDGLPAARQGDASACGSPMISAVSSTVLINGLPAVTLGSIVFRRQGRFVEGQDRAVMHDLVVA
ncbi:PAAR domain-containing protein, partial [Pseudomonas aeruginosa]|uniref:PAAR domain-containing protein n=1 Tax=Pseudomonas aeruginosa TaxID=287 RepID=UPI00211CF77F